MRDMGLLRRLFGETTREKEEERIGREHDDGAWRENPTLRTPMWAQNDIDWHDTGGLPNGRRVGKLGAKWYVLDDDGQAIGEGYHEIRVRGERLVGRVGTREENVRFPDR